MSKGSVQRPKVISSEQFSENWDKIFSKSKQTGVESSNGHRAPDKNGDQISPRENGYPVDNPVLFEQIMKLIRIIERDGYGFSFSEIDNENSIVNQR